MVHSRAQELTYQNIFPVRDAARPSKPVPEYKLPQGYGNDHPSALPQINQKRTRLMLEKKQQRGSSPNDWTTTNIGCTATLSNTANKSRHPLDHLSQITQGERRRIYLKALKQVGEKGVKETLLALRRKVEAKGKRNASLVQLKQAFHFFDKDQSSSIDVAEFHQAMETLGLQFSEPQLIALFATYDLNHNGCLDYDEFAATMQDDTNLSQGIAGASVMPWERQEEEKDCQRHGRVNTVLNAQNFVQKRSNASNSSNNKFEEQQAAAPDGLKHAAHGRQPQRSLGLSYDKSSGTYTLNRGGASGLLK